MTHYTFGGVAGKALGIIVVPYDMERCVVSDMVVSKQTQSSFVQTSSRQMQSPKDSSAHVPVSFVQPNQFA